MNSSANKAAITDREVIKLINELTYLAAEGDSAAGNVLDMIDEGTQMTADEMRAVYQGGRDNPPE